MSKSNRKFVSRLNKTAFDPDSKGRANADLRSTSRPYKDLKEERSSGHRGLLDENQS